MYVKNAHGNSNGSGWLTKYKEHFGYLESEALNCCVFGCGETATDGAHVWKCDSNGTRSESDKKLYIVPMCHEDNLQYGKHFDTKADTKPVPVSDL